VSYEVYKYVRECPARKIQGQHHYGLRVTTCSLPAIKLARQSQEALTHCACGRKIEEWMLEKEGQRWRRIAITQGKAEE